jgi:hypothetical protein
MRVRSTLLALALVVVVVLLAAGAQGKPDAGERCRMLKLGATGAYVRDLLRCHVRGLGFGLPPVPSCLAAADAKLVRTFARAEKLATCGPSLSGAQGSASSLVATLVASAAPTPVPTPAPTPTPSPMFTGCGNGVVESGEQCDGQQFCAPGCSFAPPTVCCGPVGFCLEGEFPATADQCFLAGVPYVLGAVCTPDDPGCSPTSGCAGTCTPEATFAPTSVCCELAAGCADETVGDTVALWEFVFQGCLQSSGTAVVGTCAAGGDCQPGG